MINWDIKPPEKKRVSEFPNVRRCAIIGSSVVQEKQIF